MPETPTFDSIEQLFLWIIGGFFLVGVGWISNQSRTINKLENQVRDLELKITKQELNYENIIKELEEDNKTYKALLNDYRER